MGGPQLSNAPPSGIRRRLDILLSVAALGIAALIGYIAYVFSHSELADKDKWALLQKLNLRTAA